VVPALTVRVAGLKAKFCMAIVFAPKLVVVGVLLLVQPETATMTIIPNIPHIRKLFWFIRTSFIIGMFF
jgi:hypothetical protein